MNRPTGTTQRIRTLFSVYRVLDTSLMARALGVSRREITHVVCDLRSKGQLVYAQPQIDDRANRRGVWRAYKRP
jgi:hypothetical protein